MGLTRVVLAWVGMRRIGTWNVRTEVQLMGAWMKIQFD